MDELDSLTDNELRYRLAQYGFPNMPITTTTRKTLVKKLRLYLQNAGSSLQKSKDLVTKYSSDEDSSTRPASTERSKNQRLRKSSSLATPPPPSSSSSSPRRPYNSSKNIYVSPVYINDSDEDTERSYSSFNSKSYRNSSADDDSTSKFTKRLLQLRRDNIQNNQHRTSTTTTAKKRENGRFPEQREINLSTDSQVSSLAMPKKQEGNKIYAQKHSMVSMLLMGFPIIFFTLLIIAYLNMSFNIESTMHQSSASFNICENSSEDCIEEANIESSLKLLKMVASKLREKSQGLSCGEQKQLKDNIAVCKADFDSNKDDFTRDLRNIRYLIERNPAWGIINTSEDCFTLSTRPNSLFCTVYGKIQRFFMIIGSLAIIGILFLLAKKFYYFTLEVKEKRRAQVRVIINEILSMLIEKANEDKENPFLSVNYMRDKIFGENKSFISSAWSEALTYLEQNEKRLSFGYENIHGEDHQVIRWLESIDSSINNTQQKTMATRNATGEGDHMNLKKWIGPAFEKCNKITPPTNCLKIRQMFDKYEINNDDLQACITNTILLKVQGKCKIVDIQLDRKTCCVYVKCASAADAGIVHSEINGWWLDQRLVVVKFLKEEKYDQRFPNPSNGTFLKIPQQSKFYSSSSNEQGRDRDSDIDF